MDDRASSFLHQQADRMIDEGSGWDLHHEDGTGSGKNGADHSQALAEAQKKKLAERDAQIEELKTRLAQSAARSQPITQPGSPVPGSSDTDLIQTYRSKLGKAVQHLKHLSAENTALSQRVTAHDATVAAKDAEITALQATLADSRQPQENGDSPSHIQVIEELRNRVGELETLLQQSSGREADIIQESATAKANSAEELRQTAEEVKRLTAVCENLRSASTLSDSRLADSESQNSKLAEKLNTMETQFESSCEELQVAQRNLADVNDEHLRLKQEVGSLNTTNEQLNLTISELRRESEKTMAAASAEAYEDRIREAEAKKDDYKLRWTSSEEENARLLEHIRDNAVKLEELHSLPLITEELAQAKAKLTEAEQMSARLAQLQEHNDELVAAVQTLTEANDQLTQQLDKAAPVENTAAIVLLREENENLRAQIQAPKNPEAPASTGASDQTGHTLTSSASSSDGWDVQDDMTDFDWAPAPVSNQTPEETLRKQVREKDEQLDALRRRLADAEHKMVTQREKLQVAVAKGSDADVVAAKLQALSAREVELQQEIEILQKGNESLSQQLFASIEESNARIEELENARAYGTRTPPEQSPPSAERGQPAQQPNGDAGMIARLQAQINTLEVQARYAQSSLEEEGRIHQEQITQMVGMYRQQQLEDAEQIKALQSDVERRAAIEGEREVLARRAADAQQQISSLEANQETIRIERDSLHNSVADAQQRIRELEANLENSLTMEKVEAERTVLEQAIADARDKILALEADLETRPSAAASEEERLNMARLLSDAQQKVLSLETELESRPSNAAIERERELSERSVVDLRQKISDLEEALATSTANDSDREEIKTLRQDVVASRQRVAELEAELADRPSVKALEDDLKALHARSANAENKIIYLESELAQCQTALADTEQKLQRHSEVPTVAERQLNDSNSASDSDAMVEAIVFHLRRFSAHNKASAAAPSPAPGWGEEQNDIDDGTPKTLVPQAILTEISVLAGILGEWKGRVAEKTAELDEARQQAEHLKAQVNRAVEDARLEYEQKLSSLPSNLPSTADSAPALHTPASPNEPVDLSALQSQYTQAQDTIKRLTGERTMLMDRLTTMKNTIVPKLQAEMESSTRLRSDLQQVNETFATAQARFQNENAALTQELLTSTEAVNRLEADITRLRAHLIETEDAQLAHATETEQVLTTHLNRISKLELTNAELEESCARERDAARIAADRAEAMMDEAEELKTELQRAELEHEREAMAVANLTDVLSAFQDSRQADIDAAVAHLRDELATLSTELKDYKERAETLQASPSHAAVPMGTTEELNRKTQQVGKLRHDLHIMQQHLGEALRRLNDLTAAGGELVDRQMISRLVVAYCGAPRGDPRKWDMLSVLASVLALDDADRATVGLQRAKTGAAGSKGPAVGESFTDMWISFLLKESSKHDPNAPMAITPPSRRASTSMPPATPTGTFPPILPAVPPAAPQAANPNPTP
ncbi:hypothetical protein HKX48_005808 [Thoreauomyces humboldtii]|nr:hypothetical protein HKX48_005808 [Thoreauomyces humboldtii]